MNALLHTHGIASELQAHLSSRPYPVYAAPRLSAPPPAYLPAPAQG